MNKKFNKYLLFPQNFSEKASFKPQKQCCGSKYIEFGSGSRISAQFGSGSRNLLNTDPDSDPQHWLNLKWGVVKFSSKTDPELKNSFVTVDTFNIVTFPILFQLLLKLSILKINKGVMKQFITKCYYLFMMKSGLWLKLWVTLIFMTIFKSWKVEQSFMFFTTKENSS